MTSNTQTAPTLPSLDVQEHAGISASSWQQLFNVACEARLNAHAPYSKFQVGAALLTPEGEIIQGSNIENATFGATVCAERTAFGNAVTQGFREFVALCVVTDTDPPAAPCGICRQVIAEFCQSLPIMAANPQGEYRFMTLDEVLPHRFGGSDFVEEEK